MKQRYRTLADFFEQQDEMKQADLARRLGISRSYMSLIVSGDRQPQLGLALEIQKATGVRLESLVTREVA